jgi:ribosome modulation factor
MFAVTQVGELAGIAGRRRPTIPYQAFNLTQTTKLNPTTG